MKKLIIIPIVAVSFFDWLRVWAREAFTHFSE